MKMKTKKLKLTETSKNDKTSWVIFACARSARRFFMECNSLIANIRPLVKCNSRELQQKKTIGGSLDRTGWLLLKTCARRTPEGRRRPGAVPILPLSSTPFFLLLGGGGGSRVDLPRLSNQLVGKWTGALNRLSITGLA